MDKMHSDHKSVVMTEREIEGGRRRGEGVVAVVVTCFIEDGLILSALTSRKAGKY